MTTPGRPHLLYVAWGFPPSRTGGVHRALATVNAFAADGWDVTVLTVPREVFRDVTGADPALETLVDPRVDVRRLPFRWPAQQTDLRAWPAWRVVFPRLWATVRKRRDLRAFPEVGYGPWRFTLEKAALAVHATHPVDLVISTTNPEVAVTAGVRLHEVAGVPYVVDYRDAWSLHTYSGVRRHAPDSPVGRWERRSLSDAEQIWLVNEPLRRWHAEAYPDLADRLHVVMNGYDRDLPAELAAEVDRPRDAAALRFGYLGTMTGVVPLAEFVAGWRRGREGSADLAAAVADLRGYLGYYGTPDAALAAIVDGAADAGVRYGGPVPKTEVMLTYAGFDVLLFLLGGGEYVTSGKVFEYMSTGLPIVSVLTPGCAATEVLAGYPRWHPAADLAPGTIAAALASAAVDARRPDAGARAAAAREHARRFRRDRQLLPRIAALRGRVGAAEPTPGEPSSAPDGRLRATAIEPAAASGPSPAERSPVGRSLAGRSVVLVSLGSAPPGQALVAGVRRLRDSGARVHLVSRRPPVPALAELLDSRRASGRPHGGAIRVGKVVVDPHRLPGAVRLLRDRTTRTLIAEATALVAVDAAALPAVWLAARRYRGTLAANGLPAALARL